jgi:hypothetical protein
MNKLNFRPFRELYLSIMKHLSFQTIEHHDVEGVKNWESKDKILKSLAEYVTSP